jgi:hypothetical protein
MQARSTKVAAVDELPRMRSSQAVSGVGAKK